MISWQKIRAWIIEKCQEENEAATEDLVWIKHRLSPSTKIDWSHADTVRYDISSIPRRKELVMEFEGTAKEAVEQCKNLLK